MRVLGIVPARAGSTRLPGKNLQELGGKPLVAWVIESALSASLLDRVVVTSDDPQVLAIADRISPGIALERPASLATATSPAIDYVQHALLAAESEASRFDSMAILQPTSPFTPSHVIDDVIEKLEVTGADSVVTVMRIPHDLQPAKFKTLRGDQLVDYLEPEDGRQRFDQLPAIYVRNGSVYAATRETVAAGSIIGSDCRAVVMDRTVSIDINDSHDLALARFILQEGAL